MPTFSILQRLYRRTIAIKNTKDHLSVSAIIIIKDLKSIAEIAYNFKVSGGDNATL